VILLRLCVAAILGGLVGIERENKKRAAGFRTHILVSLGSALAMITSVYIFNTYKDMTNLDPARLGAQVISGIGFLGAGTIIKQGDMIKGLTTAASLWGVACIGLAAGIGFYEAAILTGVIIYCTLVFLRKLEKTLFIKSRRKEKKGKNIKNSQRDSVSTEKIQRETIQVELKEDSEKGSIVQFAFRLPKEQNIEDFLMNLKQLYADNHDMFGETDSSDVFIPNNDEH